MSRHREQVRAAVEAARVRSSTSYSWGGRSSPRLPREVAAALSPAATRTYLVSSLQSELYGEFYCRGGVPVEPGPSPPPAPRGRTPFVEDLSVANNGRGYVERDWVVRRIDGERAVVHRDGLDLWVDRRDCDVGSGEWPGPGRRIGVRFPKENLASSPGFYLALGNRPAPVGPMVRVYWDVAADGAAVLIGAITSLLNRAGVAFQAKVLQDPGRFARADAAVLYMARPDFVDHRDTVREVRAAVGRYLGGLCPAFTRKLAAGVGLAEDPGHGDSFGMHRCGLVAEGIIRAHEDGRRSLEDRVESVVEVFAEADVDIDAPYLTPGSVDVYTI